MSEELRHPNRVGKDEQRFADESLFDQLGTRYNRLNSSGVGSSGHGDGYHQLTTYTRIPGMTCTNRLVTIG